MSTLDYIIGCSTMLAFVITILLSIGIYIECLYRYGFKKYINEIFKSDTIIINLVINLILLFTCFIPFINIIFSIFIGLLVSHKDEDNKSDYARYRDENNKSQ
jgi:ABC-type sulfate transport system permease subunit